MGQEGFEARVWAVVRRIPPGRVMSYGDVARWLGEGSPRRVGRAMARCAGGLPWHRVVHADGTPAPGGDALERLRAEGTPFRGGRVWMSRARWDGR